MATGDIKQCELDTHHARVEGRNECQCGFKTFPCVDCGEREFHSSSCNSRTQAAKEGE